MARKSRKNIPEVVSSATVQTEVGRPFRAGLYARISMETEETLERGTIETQVELMKNFVADTEDISVAEVYKDSDYSGTNFDRPGFVQMMEDIKHGKINCVIVKDLSRLGRNYVETSNYIERVFPFFHVRFLAVTDDFDSFREGVDLTVPLKNIINEFYSKDLAKKSSSAKKALWKKGKFTSAWEPYGYRKSEEDHHQLIVDEEAAEHLKSIFSITTCDEQKLSRGDQVQFQRFDTIKKKHWSPTTVAAIVRDEIYIGTRIWGKTRCSMHTGHKAVLNDETEWVRLENHHTAIIDRALFEKANEMHPKKKRSVAESRTNFTLERRKKQPALLICANCGHSLLKETEHLLKCSDARTNGDPVCRSLVIRREPLEENILGLVHQYAASMLEKEKKVSSNRQCDYKEINTAELQKQSRQLTSEKMKLYDDYKDGCIDRDSYKQRAGKISVQLDEIKRKIEDAENSKKLLEQNELSDKIKLKDFLGIQKFDTEKLREIIKVIRVHSQDEIEIEWNFDDIFSEQR